MYKCIAVFIFAVIFLVQCRSTRTADGSLRKPVEKLALNANGEALNKIVFLTYKVTYDSLTQQYNFRLTRKFFADGELNPNMLAAPSYIEPGYFLCEITGTEKAQYNKVEDPLQLIREFPSDDISGKLSKVVIHQSEGEITLRFQYIPGAKNILIKIPFPHSQQLKTIYHAQL
jgi:hypothetical protein